MESRQKLSRKARDGAASKSTRSESVDSETRSKPSDEAVPKQTGAIKKNVRALQKALSEDPAPVASAKGDPKKKMASGKGAKKPVASKTDDDIPLNVAKTKSRATKRRSRSAEPASSAPLRKRGAKADADFPDDLQIPLRKGRSKRKVSPIPEEEAPVKKPRGRKGPAKAPAAAKGGSSGSEQEEASEEATKVSEKKPRGRKGPAKAAATAKEGSSGSEQEVATDVKRRAGKRGAASARAPAAAKATSPESEGDGAKKVKGRAGKRTAATAKAPAPAKASSSESEQEEEEAKENVKSNGQALKTAKPQPANRRANVAVQRLMLSEDSEPEDRFNVLKKAKATPHPKKDRAGASKSSESEEEVAEETEPDEEPADGDDEPSPPKKSRGATKPASEEEEESQEDDEDDEPKAGKSGKKLMNKTDTDYKKIDFGIKEKFNLKIATWNVSGLRALASKNPDYFIKENADIICLNEVKLGKEADVPKEFILKGYHTYWNIGKGDNGVAIYSKVEPMKVTNDLPDTEFADAKRLITAEYEKFFLVATYVVNAGQGLKTLSKRLKWNTEFDAHVAELNKHKPVIICGDLNVSHQEIDLANPKANKKNAGFTQEERDGFSNLINSGFVDTFRALHPDTTGAYTFWSYRGNSRLKNVGWRLDYFVVSKRLMKNVKESVIRPEVLGSDHCPIVLFLNL